jgi:uncharacterized membrane protein
MILLFLLVFILRAPALSLMAGAVFIGIPPLYYSIDAYIKNRNNNLKFYKVVPIVNIILFISFVIIVLTHIGYEFPAYDANNLSNISHILNVNQNARDLMKSSLIFFAVMIVTFLFVKSDNSQEGDLNQKIKKIVFILVIGLVIYQITHFSILMVHRVKALGTTTYDFGLFSQMFYSMKNSGTMITTLERSEPLSHLAVHFSLIYYIYLPIFMIFPYPETLEVLQIITVAAGIIPIYLIAKHFNLSIYLTGLLVVMYIFNPALIGSSFFDLHENCFLPVLILFTIYFMLKQKLIPLLIFMFLTLIVKEDASIYTFVIGFYFLMSHMFKIEDIQQKKKNIIYSIIMIVGSVMYFLFVQYYLDNFGDGAMTWRYDNLNGYPEISLFGVVVSIFQNPSYFLATMFNPERVYFLAISILMMGMLPLFLKNIGDYWLIVPFIIFNLASGYQYQHVYGYQYYYGSTALLLFMAILVLSNKTNYEHRIKPILRQNPIFYIIMVITLTISGIRYINTKDLHYQIYKSNPEYYDAMREFLMSIPSDKKIYATQYLTTYLSNREVLYDYTYLRLNEGVIRFDYIILDRRNANVYTDSIVEDITQFGYVYSDFSNEYFLIYEDGQA